MRAHERPADERAQAELEAILARRPDLKARALEAVKRMIDARGGYPAIIAFVAHTTHGQAAAPASVEEQPAGCPSSASRWP